MRAGFASLVAAAVSTLVGCASVQSDPRTVRNPGWSTPLGNGTVTSYAEFDANATPTAIGVVFSAASLDGLPTGSDHHRCFNRSKDGFVDAGTLCQHSNEYVLPLPDAAALRSDIPFKWVLLNWNPAGHIPPGVYDVAHFDIHFQMAPIAQIFAIEPGPCGPEYVRCDQFQIATKRLPTNYVHPDYRDVGAVVPAMGNHLIDLTGPEFNKQPFTRSWIYGAYDGKVIFYEEMVTRDHLLRTKNACVPVKAPDAVDTRGFYPTLSCIRQDSTTGDYTVSMEGFVLRDSSPPAWTPPPK